MIAGPPGRLVASSSRLFPAWVFPDSCDASALPSVIYCASGVWTPVVGANMKAQFKNKEIIVLLAVSLMSLLANLPEGLGAHFIDRKLLLAALIGVVTISLFRYLKVLLLVAISILTIGANLPAEMALALGISQAALLVALGALVAVTLLNRVFNLLPTQSEAWDEEDVPSMGSNARQFLLKSISHGDIATVQRLLEMNVAADFRLNGTTPLHVATEKGYSNIVELLLEHGADVLAKNADGDIPLDIALAKKKFVRTTEILFAATMPHISASDQMTGKYAQAH